MTDCVFVLKWSAEMDSNHQTAVRKINIIEALQQILLGVMASFSPFLLSSPFSLFQYLVSASLFITLSSCAIFIYNLIYLLWLRHYISYCSTVYIHNMVLIISNKPQEAMVYIHCNPCLHWAYCFHKTVTTLARFFKIGTQKKKKKNVIIYW